MAVLVDPPAWPAHGRRWSHLVSDESLAELHTFARRLGVPERGFEGDHYDIPEERYADAVHAGAIPVSSRELLRRLQQSGLRRPKRRGEKVLASVHGPQDGVRVDTLLSSRRPTGGVRALVVVAQRGRELLVLPDGDGFTLPRAELAEADGPEDGRQDVEHDVARSLVTGLLGPAWSLATSTQIGYLRTVRPDRPPGLFEVVLRWVAPSGIATAQPAAPARWVDRHDGAGLLPPALAPLVRAGS